MAAWPPKRWAITLPGPGSYGHSHGRGGVEDAVERAESGDAPAVADRGRLHQGERAASNAQDDTGCDEGCGRAGQETAAAIVAADAARMITTRNRGVVRREAERSPGDRVVARRRKARVPRWQVTSTVRAR